MSKKLWTPLHLHSQYSTLDGLSQAKHIRKRCVELGYESCAITDHGTIAGTIALAQEFKDEKTGIKTIFGNELYLTQDLSTRDKKNRGLSHLVVLAKNLAGWKTLVQITSDTNRAEHYYYKPRTSLLRLGEFLDGNIVSFSGHPGSDLANILFTDAKAAYGAKSITAAQALVDPDAITKCIALARLYEDLFGKGNFFIEVQLIDPTMPASSLIGDMLREVSKKTGIPCVGTADSHYSWKEQAEDQRILLCSLFHKTLKQCYTAVSDDEDFGLSGFFRSSNFHIPSVEEIAAVNNDEEMENSMLIAQMCENYSVFSKPKLPKFDCPDGMGSPEYLRKLCRDSLAQKSHLDNQTYRDRMEQELAVFEKAGISSYFLVVQDYVNVAKARGELIGAGRGSAAGCLVSYLIGITRVDPIEHDLSFERFYNEGRNTPEKTALPDIDIDFMKDHRHKTTQYIRDKYGKDRVGNMVTFARMQGRSAIKEVLRAHGVASNDEMNRITGAIPDESSIADELQDMREAGVEPSIIRWSLENRASKLSEWCRLSDDGELEGPLAYHFAQAMRIEGTKKSQGKHASGLIVSLEPLSDVCPMIQDKSSDELMCGLEMGALEAMGLVKLDVLALNTLDVMQDVHDILLYGEAKLQFEEQLEEQDALC